MGYTCYCIWRHDRLGLGHQLGRLNHDRRFCRFDARHEYITGKKRGDRHTRDILLNSSLLGWEATAQFIEELVERRFGLTEEKLKKEA